MEGVDVAVADPIPPVAPEDDRASVKDLIQKHGEKIAKIRAELEDDPLFEPTKHDDLWILRFLLSHKKSKDAIKAAKHTLQFRKEHSLDDKDIREVSPNQVQEGKVKEFTDCWDSDAVAYGRPDPKRGVVSFIKMRKLDQHVVLEKLTPEHWAPLYIYIAEWTFQWLDYLTRTTGRLTKNVRLIDMTGFTMSGYNHETTKRDGAAMADTEDCYPQMLESIYICNPPTVVAVVWKLAKVFMPTRVVSKFGFLSPKTNAKDRKLLCRHITEQNLPDFYGGKNPIPPEEW